MKEFNDNLSDQRKDEFISNALKKDVYISDKANDVFNIFINKQSNNTNENVNNYQSIENTHFDNKNENANSNINENKNVNQSFENKAGKVFNLFDYSKMNRILSVAAVFLCAVFVGTGILVRNKRNNENTTTEIVSNYAVVRNKELKFNKEEVLQESENDLVKVSLIGDKKVAIQIKQKYMDIYGLNLSSDKTYEVNNINKKVKDVFAGYIVNSNIPHVVLLMNDGTIEGVEIAHNAVDGTNQFEFYFESQGTIKSLDNVIGFMQGSRTYTESDDLYYYISAIRKDGKSKAIEFYDYNSWDDEVDDVYESFNERYKEEAEQRKNANNNFGNYTVWPDTSTDDEELKNEFERKVYESGDYYKNKLGYYCMQLPTDSEHAYYIDNNELFRTDISGNSEVVSWLASGVEDLDMTDEGYLLAKLDIIYSIRDTSDSNIVYKEYDVTDAATKQHCETEDVQVLIKTDGTIATRVLIGGLKKLGFNPNETIIEENVFYNTYVNDLEDNNNTISTNANIGFLRNLGKDDRLCFVYGTKDGYVKALDICSAIEHGSFTLGLTSIQHFNGEINGFEARDVTDDKDEKGKKIPKYVGLYVHIKDKNGKEKSELFKMPFDLETENKDAKEEENKVENKEKEN